MTDQQHPITPPTELVLMWQWLEDGPEDDELRISKHIATQAARWGADQELEACCAYLAKAKLKAYANGLQFNRRPEPFSLKEQALMALEDGDLGPGASLTPVEVCIIRRALEALDD